jgi:hypothetical protein
MPEREDWESDVRCATRGDGQEATRDVAETQHRELFGLELLRVLPPARGKQHTNFLRVLHDVERGEQRPVAIDREAASRRTLYGGRPSDTRRTTAMSSSANEARSFPLRPVAARRSRIASHRKRAT